MPVASVPQRLLDQIRERIRYITVDARGAGIFTYTRTVQPSKWSLSGQKPTSAPYPKRLLIVGQWSLHLEFSISLSLQGG